MIQPYSTITQTTTQNAAIGPIVTEDLLKAIEAVVEAGADQNVLQNEASLQLRLMKLGTAASPDWRKDLIAVASG